MEINSNFSFQYYDVLQNKSLKTFKEISDEQIKNQQSLNLQVLNTQNSNNNVSSNNIGNKIDIKA